MAPLNVSWLQGGPLDPRLRTAALDQYLKLESSRSQLFMVIIHKKAATWVIRGSANKKCKEEKSVSL